MHGNASEWVWDWYPAGAPYYDVTQTNNPTGPAVGSSRVVRGGNWTNLSRSIRSASRILAKSDERGNSIGFRLAKTM